MMVSKLIILVVIVLGAILIAQIMKIQRTLSEITGRKEEEISQKNNRLNANLMLLFMIVLFGGFIYLMQEYGWTGRGSSASKHGHDLDWLLNLNLIIILIVFFLTHFFLLYFSFKYVKKPGVKAYFFPHSSKLEMIWTFIPASALAVIIILGLTIWNDVTSESSAEAIRVELFSKQFDWTARYSGKDNKLGKFDYKLTLDNNQLALMTTNTIDSAIQNMETGPQGIKTLEAKLKDKNFVTSKEEKQKIKDAIDRKSRLVRLLYQMKNRYDSKMDVMAWDDIIQKDTLYLCVNKEYEMTFRSKDVIHSAYFPDFRVQMNTVPGMTTRFKFTPDITTKEFIKKNNKPKDFNFSLMCNKICGGAHYKMKMIVVVLDEKEYNDWMSSKANATFKDKYFAKTN